MATTPITGNRGDLRVFPDPKAVAHAAAELFTSQFEASARKHRRFRVSLSGGSTPKLTYELLATPEFNSRIDWSLVDLFWGDERYVPHDHPESNYGMTHKALLQHVPVPPSSIHAVPTELRPADAAASAYEEDIRKTFGSDEVPVFDLIFLGLGTNGHTASLFPHSTALKETKRLVIADFVQEVNMWRISMTAPLLNRGRVVAFLIAGQDKAQVLRDVMLGPRDPDRLPAQLIAPEGQSLWMIDEAAASLVSHDKSSQSERDARSTTLRKPA